jgi:phosphohistidine phosphatase
MKIYLVQHGKPLPKEKDPDRSLSELGRQDIEKVAAFLKEIGIEVQEIFHSGKTRARQTAKIMISKLSPGREPLKKDGLSPLDDVKAIAEEINQTQKDLMIVGHLPHLAKLTSVLTGGSESNPVVAFQQGGVVCLQSDKERNTWAIAWMLVPEIVPGYED